MSIDSSRWTSPLHTSIPRLSVVEKTKSQKQMQSRKSKGSDLSTQEKGDPKEQDVGPAFGRQPEAYTTAKETEGGNKGKRRRSEPRGGGENLVQKFLHKTL